MAPCITLQQTNARDSRQGSNLFQFTTSDGSTYFSSTNCNLKILGMGCVVSRWNVMKQSTCSLMDEQVFKKWCQNVCYISVQIYGCRKMNRPNNRSGTQHTTYEPSHHVMTLSQYKWDFLHTSTCYFESSGIHQYEKKLHY
jgi:hypothetical protein